jgi:hypothetical protein
MRYGPGTDAWLSPPDPKVPPSGDTCIYVERGDDELEVVVVFDEGSIWSAKVDGKDFELTADEKQRAEEDWAMREPEERDEPERDWDR